MSTDASMGAGGCGTAPWLLGGRLGAGVAAQWNELRHAAAVIGTVHCDCVQPRYWSRTRWKAFTRQVRVIGVEPLRFAGAVAEFVGITVVVQLTFWTGEAGQSQMLGPLLLTVVARELGPILINRIVIVRSGSAMTTELGGCKIAGAVHSMEARGSDPFLHLVSPRVLGMAVATFSLTIVFILVVKSHVTLRVARPGDGAAGIRQGKEFYFLGPLVGAVSDVVADEQGRREAPANIRRDFFRFIRTDSSAVVKRKFGVAGNSFFAIPRGGRQPLPDENAAIVGKEQLQSALEAAVVEVRREAMLVLKKVNGGMDPWTTLGSNLITTRARFDPLVGRVDDLATDIQAGKDTVGKLRTDNALGDEAQTLLGRANAALGELQGGVPNLNAAVKNVQDGRQS